MTEADETAPARLDMAHACVLLGRSGRFLRELCELGYLPAPDADETFDAADFRASLGEIDAVPHGRDLAVFLAAKGIGRGPGSFLDAFLDAAAGAERAGELEQENEHAQAALARALDENTQLAEKLKKARAAGAPARTKLIALALAGDVELSHHDGEAFATVPAGGRAETMKLRGREFKRWLNARFYAETGSAAGSDALGDAVLTAEGRAMAEGAARPVHVRLAGHDGRIYLDLGREDWKVVEIGRPSLSSGGHPSAGYGPKARPPVGGSDASGEASGEREAGEDTPQTRDSAAERPSGASTARSAEPPTGGRPVGPDSRDGGRAERENNWRVIEAADAPVRFIRPKGVRPLPEPRQGGKLEWLKRYVNVEADDMVLVFAWLVAALRPIGPYPILALSAEQGAGKSTVTRVLRRLVDPSAAEINTLPREERDLMIAAKNSWCLALDNISTIPPWMADAICRLATGGGFRARMLHTDDDETLFEAQRPQILNGIGELASRPDLADRALVVRLPAIPDDEREPESAFWADFAEDHPLLLGALLDVVAGALKRLDSVQLELFPRMADFALWAQAAEPDLPVTEGAFLATYGENAASLTQAAVDDSPFIAGVADWARKQDGQWAGTAGELLAVMKAKFGDSPAVDMPKSPRGVSARLRRYLPALRAAGVKIEMDHREGGTGRRLIAVSAEAKP